MAAIIARGSRSGYDAEGRMLALRASITANLGAYLSQFGPFIPTAAGAADV